MAAPSHCVEIARHTYDCFEVVAYDMHGRVMRRRMFVFGARRKEWAIEQARRWSEEFGLWFSGKIFD